MSVTPMLLLLFCLFVESPVGETVDSGVTSQTLSKTQGIHPEGDPTLREELEVLKKEMMTLQRQQLNWGVLSLSQRRECQMPEWWKELQTIKDELTTRKHENDLFSKKLEALSEAERWLKNDLLTKSKQIEIINGNYTTMKRGIDSGNVAFEVVAIAHVSITPDEIYKFDTVVLNNGGGYHAPTGIFEAPVSGTYLFWGNVHHPHTYNHITVVKEGVTLAVAANDGQENNLVYLADVKQGERVWFSRGGRYTGQIYGAKHSSYGGCLVHVH